ncbi:retrovirus-related pol polyprotein from transposon TNT 1-94 [Tanacetum coccineum]
MSMMGKLSFFLGLQISQSPREIFLNQSKYALESLKKYGMETCEPADTPMVEKSKLDEDTQGKAIDPTRYCGMMNTLMYLTSSRPALVFPVCMCARYRLEDIFPKPLAHLGERLEFLFSKIWNASMSPETRKIAGRDEEVKIMNPQETQQVATRDEKWVPFTKRVKISSTNVRLETTVPQKEETFQVVIDLIKNSSCFKAFAISTDVPKIFMQQFWYSIKKVQGTDSYEFLLANKKYVFNTDVFRTILDICPRVDGVDFTDIPDDDAILAFLIKLG